MWCTQPRTFPTVHEAVDQKLDHSLVFRKRSGHRWPCTSSSAHEVRGHPPPRNVPSLGRSTRRCACLQRRALLRLFPHSAQPTHLHNNQCSSTLSSLFVYLFSHGRDHLPSRRPKVCLPQKVRWNQCSMLSGQNVFCCGSLDMNYIRLSQSFVGKAKYFIWKVYG